jgi:hypothetical protein
MVIKDFDKFKNDKIAVTYNDIPLDYDEVICKICKPGDRLLIQIRLNKDNDIAEFITYDK